jgi:hypothetical protein
MIFGRSLRSWLAAMMLAVTLLATAMPTPARADDDEPFVYDARVQGFSKPVQLPSSSTALTWLLLIVLAGACIGVMFMDAKRSHLD